LISDISSAKVVPAVCGRHGRQVELDQSADDRDDADQRLTSTPLVAST
jgi:hypothetical protein